MTLLALPLCNPAFSVQQATGPARVDVEALVLLNKDIRGNRVIVTGMLACADETYCRLRGNRQLRHAVTVEWDLLGLADRKAMLLCRYDRPCLATFDGYYGYHYDLQPTSVTFKSRE